MKAIPFVALVALIPVGGCAGTDQGSAPATTIVSPPASDGTTTAPVSPPADATAGTGTGTGTDTGTGSGSGASGADASATSVSAAEWTAMLKAATPGSTIDLGSRKVAFARYTGLSNVTIKGGVFGAISLDQWKNVTFSGTRFEPRDGDDPAGSMIIAYQPDGLKFDCTSFTGAMNADGQLGFSSISVRGGNNVSVTRSTFSNIGNFLAFLRTTNVQVTDNSFSYIREGVDLVGTRNVVVARNSFGPYRPTPTDHADGIQFFTAGLTDTGDTAAQNVLIEDNLVDPGAGYRAQGFFLRDEAGLAASGRGYSDITIRNNVLIGTGWHGIAAGDPVQRLLIENNRLLIRLNPTDTVTSNWILVAAGGSATVQGNVAGNYNLAAGVVASNNTTIARAATSAEIADAMAAWAKSFTPAAQCK